MKKKLKLVEDIKKKAVSTIVPAVFSDEMEKTINDW